MYCMLARPFAPRWRRGRWRAPFGRVRYHLHHAAYYATCVVVLRCIRLCSARGKCMVHPANYAICVTVLLSLLLALLMQLSTIQRISCQALCPGGTERQQLRMARPLSLSFLQCVIVYLGVAVFSSVYAIMQFYFVKRLHVLCSV